VTETTGYRVLMFGRVEHYRQWRQARILGTTGPEGASEESNRLCTPPLSIMSIPFCAMMPVSVWGAGAGHALMIRRHEDYKFFSRAFPQDYKQHQPSRNSLAF
jgi:hypothetical protein